jgi:hypothetical protein
MATAPSSRRQRSEVAEQAADRRAGSGDDDDRVGERSDSGVFIEKAPFEGVEANRLDGS